jgi:hypothetical protein
MKEKGFKAIHTFCRSESGVSTAVAAALLIGIAVIFMTTVEIKYMPVWKEDAEYAHMSDVWHDMSRFKSNVDIMTAGLEINPNARIVLNSPIQVGGSEIPFIRSTTTGGSLAINNDISGMFVVINTDNSSVYWPSGRSLYYTGTVFYRPSNLNYVNEVYCYENGALIVSQDDRSVMKLDPGIVMERGTNAVNLSIRGVYLDGPRGVLSSNTVEDIRLTSESFTRLYPDIYYNDSYYNITSVNVTIYTDNKEAWKDYFNDSASDINLHEGMDYNLYEGMDYDLNSSVYDAVTFSLHPAGKKLYAKVYRSDIKIETGLQ